MSRLSLALAIALHAACWGQPSAAWYTLEPPEFSIGDIVTLRADAPGLSRDSAVELLEGQAGSGDYYVHSIQALAGSLEMRFSVFTIREVQLPSVTLKGSSIELPRVQARSSFEGAAAAPERHRGPSPLPGTGTRLSFFALSIVAGAGAIFVLLVLGRRLGALAVEAYREGLPYRCLLRRLKELDGAPDSGSFYEGLVRAIKEYLEGCCGIKCAPMTSPELEEAMRDRLSPEDSMALRRILQTADAAKFGGLEIDPALREEQASEARLIAERLSRGIEEAA